MRENEMCEDITRRAGWRGRPTEGRAPFAVWRGASALPPREFLPDRSGTAEWPMWDTAAHLIVTAPERLVEARELATELVAAVAHACDPSRPDSEVRALQEAHGHPVQVSPLLAELVALSLREARRSDGDVDPICGNMLRRSERELLLAELTGGGVDRPVPRPPDWRSIRRNGREITVPAGALLDLDAMARAHAADLAAWLIYKRYEIGVLVGIGGDIATAGNPPAGGWWTLMRQSLDGPSTPVRLPFAALATSSAVSGQWRGGGRPLHYAVCPGTSRPAAPMWRSVTVGAFRCTCARTLSTAALVRGAEAPGWLRDRGVAARLVAADGEVVTVGRWPADDRGGVD
ncbi:MAG TPA: FAD:protein FMN transferase [Planosporangium sp.]|nr:FAD:protein FMN transferase [Planosporangium sp.]